MQCTWVTRRGGARIHPFLDLIWGLAVEAGESCCRSLPPRCLLQVNSFSSFVSVFMAAVFCCIQVVLICWSLWLFCFTIVAVLSITLWQYNKSYMYKTCHKYSLTQAGLDSQVHDVDFVLCQGCRPAVDPAKHILEVEVWLFCTTGGGYHCGNLFSSISSYFFPLENV